MRMLINAEGKTRDSMKSQPWPKILRAIYYSSLAKFLVGCFNFSGTTHRTKIQAHI